MIELLLSEEAWLIIGLIFIIAEMTIGTNYVLLAFGLGCLLNGILIFSGMIPVSYSKSLVANVALITVISFVLLFALRKFLSKPDDKDINQY